MAKASDNSEWFSCGLQLPPRSLSLLFFHARACGSLSFSYIDTSTANANSQRLVCCTFKADVGTGLVAEVPHVMEIIMALDVVVDHSFPSQFVSTAKKQSWPRNLNQPFFSFFSSHCVDRLTGFLSTISATNMASISTRANFPALKIEDLLVNIIIFCPKFMLIKTMMAEVNLYYYLYITAW